MSVYKRHGSRFWWYKLSVPGSRPRRFLRGSTGTEDKQTATAIENTLRLSQRRSLPAEQLHKLIDALSGTQTEKSGIPIHGITAEYRRIWSMSGRQVAEKTGRNRVRVVENLLHWIAENRPATSMINEIDKMTASAYSMALQRSVKSKTRKNIIEELSTVWRVLGSIHDVANPWPGVIPKVDDSESGKAFSRQEERALIAAADAAGNDWGLMCRVARATGLRYGDVARLTGEDIDRDAGAIRMRPSKTRRHGVAVLIPLPASVLDLLPEGSGPLFQSASKYYPHNIPDCPFVSVLGAAGLAGRGFTFHSWRHTFRTRLSEAGVSDDIAKRLGGWRHDKTATHYDHSERLDELRNAVESAQ